MNNPATDIGAIFENAYRKLLSNDLCNGIGGEIPLYIQPFPAEHQAEADQLTEELAKRLGKKGKSAIVINLYDLCMEILSEEGILETLLTDESSLDKDDILATLDSVLDVKSVVIPRLCSLIEETSPDFVLISGVGSVYPFLRSHSILNNLEELASHQAVVLFFPGNYNKLQLSLFGRISDENYYRGLNLDDAQTPNQDI